MTETDTKRCEDTPNERERWRLVLTPILPGRSGCWPLQRRLVLGRGEDCSHVIREDHVSRHHAEIVPQGPVVTVKDLGSKNG
ncbi:MAG TPA: FHA domain-containing protein, partial [Polyangiaceae bacterium]|nr:FHA domain-containing protein [Polyangiaceae bacterium]